MGLWHPSKVGGGLILSKGSRLKRLLSVNGRQLSFDLDSEMKCIEQRYQSQSAWVHGKAFRGMRRSLASSVLITKLASRWRGCMFVWSWNSLWKEICLVCHTACAFKKSPYFRCIRKEKGFKKWSFVYLRFSFKCRKGAKHHPSDFFYWKKYLSISYVSNIWDRVSEESSTISQTKYQRLLLKVRELDINISRKQIYKYIDKWLVMMASK